MPRGTLLSFTEYALPHSTKKHSTLRKPIEVK